MHPIINPDIDPRSAIQSSSEFATSVHLVLRSDGIASLGLTADLIVRCTKKSDLLAGKRIQDFS
jgi:hypothetical protein